MDESGASAAVPTAVPTASEVVVAVFSLLGRSVPVSSAAEMAKLQTLTATMGPYYAGLRAAAEWLVALPPTPPLSSSASEEKKEKEEDGKGNPRVSIDSYLAASFSSAILASIAADASAAAAAAAAAVVTPPGGDKRKSGGTFRGGLAVFDDLIGEQTKGGYNEQAIRLLDEAGAFDAIKRTLTAVNDRWEGRTPCEQQSFHCYDGRGGRGVPRRERAGRLRGAQAAAARGARGLGHRQCRGALRGGGRLSGSGQEERTDEEGQRRKRHHFCFTTTTTTTTTTIGGGPAAVPVVLALSAAPSLRRPRRTERR